MNRVRTDVNDDGFECARSDSDKELIKTMIDKLRNILKNKIVLRILWGLSLILFLLLFTRYREYRQMKKYYNTGIEYFNDGDYELAERYFENALWQKKTKRQECKIRINLALSIVTPITPESVTEDNIDEQIERLIEARDYLTQNGCANADDSNGHNRKAQTLKEEIDEYIEKLKEQKEEQEKASKDTKSDDKKDGDNNKNNDGKDDDKQGGQGDDQKKGQEENGQGQNGQNPDNQNPENQNEQNQNNQNELDEQKKQEEEQKRQEEEQKRKEEEERRQQEEKQRELEETFNQIEQQGLSERNSTLEQYETWKNGGYSSGKNW